MKRSLILTLMVAVMLLLMISVSSGISYDSLESNVLVKVTDNIEVTPLMIDPTPTPEIKENVVADSDIEAETEVMYYTENEVVMMAKLLYRECRGIPSDTEKACVAWTVCNRVDDERFVGYTITEIMTAPNQFAYYYNTPVTDELYWLAQDVLARWNAERNGEVSVGRVLPKDYTHYTGDGVHNYFRNAYKGNYSIWNYSLPSPYES